uniref:UDP-glucuronosyltransferase n=1 Tax=Ascaris suum TaxID=6253 RepID=F1L3T2_ASCSU
MTPAINVFIAIVTVVNMSNAANVLVMSMHGSSSHIGSMQGYLMKLAEAGHSITVLETNGRKGANDYGSGIKTEHIYIPDNIKDKEAYSEIWWRSSPTSALVTSIYYAIGDKALQKILKLDPETFWRVANSSWDLIVVDELFTVHGYGVATLHKRSHSTPYIIFSPSLMFFTNYVINSLGRCSVCRMQLTLSSTDEIDYQPSIFSHRARNFFEHFIEYIALGYFVQWFGMPHLREMGISNFTWHEYFRDASAIFSDSIINIGHPTPGGTELTNIGSRCANINSTLTEDLDEFIADPTSQGTIYAAFGTHANWNTAPTFLRDAFMTAFEELTDYRIIFAYNGAVTYIPKHVRIVKFAPQKEILNDNRTKLFISHGGLKSMKESICAGVPVVFMPIFAEQAHNALLARQLGIGETLNKSNVTKERIMKQIKKVLDSDEYIYNIVRVKQLFLDRVIPALDHSLFLTERILRHPHRPIYFRRKGIDLMWTQYLYLDLAFIIFFALLIAKC